MRKVRRGVAVHVYNLNAIECLLAWLGNVSGLFDPLELLETVVIGAEGFDRIAGFDVLGAHLSARDPFAGLGRFTLPRFHGLTLFAVHGVTLRTAGGVRVICKGGWDVRFWFGGL